MSEIYRHNLKALEQSHTELFQQLEAIQSNDKYEVFRADEEAFASILDTEKERWVVHENNDNFEHYSSTFSKYREYPFLYLFGMGNGEAIRWILDEIDVTQLIVVEPSLELIYIALNLIDLSREILTKRLYIFTTELLSFTKCIEIFHIENAKFYVKEFQLRAISHYYDENFQTEYEQSARLFYKAIEHIVKAFGNDIADTFVGLKHHIKNLPLMVSRARISELVQKKNSELAVIVATGPSLYKQLALLREYQERVTIISLDASFPILVKEGIRADIVVSMERDEPTATFFANTTQEEREGVIFLCASLQHEALFKALEGSNIMLAMRPFAYNYYFDLDEFGYICAGMSSANMAHELALSMQFKQTVFIGQDLAYGKDGTSHSQGHIFGKEQIKDGVNSIGAHADKTPYETLTTQAYAGEGEVETIMFWNLFRTFIEQYIEKSQDVMKTYNATEGGARIHGSIEEPFESVLEKYALTGNKVPITVSKPDNQAYQFYFKVVENKIEQILSDVLTLKEHVDNSFLIIAQASKRVENVSVDEAVSVFSSEETVALLEVISSIRQRILDNTIYHRFYSSIAQALLFHEEMALAKIKVQYVDNAKDNQIKALQWILAHRIWLFQFSGVLQHIYDVVKEQSATYLPQGS